jgi:hypothetical protein
MKRSHNFRLDFRQEFDEVYVERATVHIERMDDACYWIGIDSKSLPSLRIFTGMQRGVWFFNIQEDSDEGRTFTVRRPRRCGAGKSRRKVKR